LMAESRPTARGSVKRTADEPLDEPAAKHPTTSWQGAAPDPAGGQVDRPEADVSSYPSTAARRLAELRARVLAKSGARGSEGAGFSPASVPRGVTPSAVQAGVEGSRTEERAVDELGLARASMASVFGDSWSENFHYSHKLLLSAPLVFCKVCGHYCESGQHLLALRQQCTGPPSTGSVYIDRLRNIWGGTHPTGGHRLGRATPLPAGSRGKAAP